MRQVHFSEEAFTQFTGWATADPALFQRLTRLIGEAARSPFDGIGKPEPLKHQLRATGRAASMQNIGWFTK
jgi:toxin YoeB